jgi:glucosamine-6-phosphate deaminase
MAVKVIVTRDFDHMSREAAEAAKGIILETRRKKGRTVLGLATGNSPTGMYRILARAANSGEFDPKRVRSFNLDEYIGLPGENAQQRVIHPESYCYFMIQEFFSLLKTKFSESCVPYGSLVDQRILEAELAAHPSDYRYEGTDAGKSLVIKKECASEYLALVRKDVQEAYENKIKAAGGIDLQVIGSGGRGHVAFHEAGIPFKDSRVLIVKLDDDTIRNAVADGHFAAEADSPRFAVSMGAELVYEAANVLLVANGERKREPITRSLLDAPNAEVPISYGQEYAKKGGNLIYVVDRIAGADLLASRDKLAARGIVLEDKSA